MELWKWNTRKLQIVKTHLETIFIWSVYLSNWYIISFVTSFTSNSVTGKKYRKSSSVFGQLREVWQLSLRGRLWFRIYATIYTLLFFFSISFHDLTVFCQGYPEIVSGPSDPLISRSEDKATLNWTLGLPPSETWNSSIFEVVFGIWKDPGFLKTKLLVIDRHGEVLIRPNYEKKISCDFNMSKLQVAFILHNLTMKDENHYCLQVELGLHQPPLTDPVMLLLEGNIIVTFHL